MVKRFAIAGLAAAAFVAAAAVATPAVAGNVAWGVTVGGPGFAVSAGQPAYGGWSGGYYGPAPYASVAVAPPVVYPYAAPYVGVVARPYYARYRPYVYARGWHGPVRYAHGYGWH